MQRLLLVVAACGALTACKKEPAARAKNFADATDFWPEAPKPTVTTGTRTFQYKPANIARYRMTADGGATSTMPLKFKMLLDLDFRAADAPTDRNAHIDTLEMSLSAGSTGITMRMNSDEFYFKEKDQETRIKRGEQANIDVADLTEKPISIVTFDDTTNTVTIRSNPEHPFAQLGGGAEDMLDSATLLFPDLPKGPVSPGHRWSSTRKTPVGSTNTKVDVTYDFVYVGDGACPSGAGTCSLLTFTAASKGVDAVSDEGRKLRVAYGFAGKVFFNHDRGVIDESRVRTDIDATSEGLDLPIGATYSLAPRS